MSASSASLVNRFVLDTSVPLAWFLPAKEVDRLYAKAVFDLIIANSAVCVIDIEMGSVLLARRRFKDAQFPYPAGAEHEKC